MSLGQGKTAFVTGANTGLGYETALQLAQKGYRVLVGSRSVERGNAAITTMRKSAPNASLECVELNLDSLDAVMKCAETVRKTALALHVLVLNAGTRETTKDGFERCFGVNHLGHYLLTLALVGALKAGSPSRVVVVSSLTHANITGFEWEDLLLVNKGAWTRARAYQQSKLANVLFAYEFNRRYSHVGIYANALEPGLVASDILRESNAFVRTVGTWVLRIGGRSAAGAAYTSVYVASDASLEGVGGKFFQPYWSKCRETRSSPESYDEFVAAQLWDESAKLVALERRVGRNTLEILKNPSVRVVPRRHNTIFSAIAVAVAAVVIGLLVLRLV